MKEQLVTNLKTLRTLAKAGFIVLHEQTGTKITYIDSKKPFTCIYIKGRADDKGGYFQYGNKTYLVKYEVGCFSPFVFEYSEGKGLYSIETGQLITAGDNSRFKNIDTSKYFVEAL